MRLGLVIFLGIHKSKTVCGNWTNSPMNSMCILLCILLICNGSHSITSPLYFLSIYIKNMSKCIKSQNTLSLVNQACTIAHLRKFLLSQKLPPKASWYKIASKLMKEAEEQIHGNQSLWFLCIFLFYGTYINMFMFACLKPGLPIICIMVHLQFFLCHIFKQENGKELTLVF